jgi:hypothetical protein
MEIHDSCIRTDFGCKSLLKISQAQYYYYWNFDLIVTTFHLDFYGVTTEENPAIANHVHMNSDGTSQIGGRFLHGTRREWTLPDSCTSRYVK